MAQLPPQAGSKEGSRSITCAPRFPQQLFIHCVASLPGFSQLAGHVAGVDKYGERALLLAEADDFVCLAHSVPPEYLEMLNGLGLGPSPSHIIRLPESLDRQTTVPMSPKLVKSLESGMRLPTSLGRDQPIWVNSFAASETDAALQTSLQSQLGNHVSLINQHPGPELNLYDKNVVRRHAPSCGLPLPPGEAVAVDRKAGTAKSRTAELRQAICKYLDTTGRVIVRGALGASGSSVFLVGRDEYEIEACIRQADGQTHTNDFLVEPFFDVDVSPNIGMFIDPRDKKVSCVSISDQLLEGGVCHVGNRYPSEAQLLPEMIAAAEQCCRWLADRETTGFLGFDFCEFRRPGRAERDFFFAEINPRLNGATYPAHVLSRLNARAPHPRWTTFRAMTIETDLSSYSAFRARCGDLLFDGRQSTGLIPYNVGLLQHGKLMVTVVGESVDDVVALETEFRSRASWGAVPSRGSFQAVA